MSSEYIGYIPVPHWDGRAWQPCDHTRQPVEGEPTCDGHPLLPWPEGFDPATIPPPQCNPGDVVRFLWGGGMRRGVIRQVRKSGGGLRHSEADALAAARERYGWEPHYDIVWNGHVRWVDERHIAEGYYDDE